MRFETMLFTNQTLDISQNQFFGASTMRDVVAGIAKVGKLPRVTRPSVQTHENDYRLCDILKGFVNPEKLELK